MNTRHHRPADVRVVVDRRQDVTGLEPVLRGTELELVPVDGELVSAVERLRARSPATPVVVFAPGVDADLAIRAFRAGAAEVARSADELATFVRAGVRERLRTEGRLALETESNLLLQEVASAANDAGSVEEALPRVLAAACRSLGFTYAHCFVREDDGPELVSAGVFHPEGADPEFTRVCLESRFALGDGLVGRVATSGRPHWWIRGSGGHRRSAAMEAAGLATTVATPVWIGERVVAVVELFDGRPRARDDRVLALMASLGQALGRVFERDRARHMERQLVQAQKMEALGRLTGGIAHDFNNLLTVIRLQLELLAEGADDPQSVDDLELAKGAANRAADLTRRLLSFSRRSVTEPRATAVPEVLEDLAPMIRRVIGETIEVDLALDEAPRVLIDRGQLEQVLVNLAVNARDAMPRGGRLSFRTCRLEVSPETRLARAGARPGPHAVLEVQDTGVGIPAEVRDRIFEPFFTTKERDRGTGLGLATVHGIVRQHGGAIVVESQVGRGTTFTVALPATAQPPAETLRPPPRPSRGVRDTLLLVDDDPLVRRSLQRSLTQRGFGVLVASRAEEALQLLEKGPPARAVLSDLIMPGMSGAELAREIATRWPGLPVLLMSAYASPALSGGPAPPPGTVFVAKPFVVDEVIQALERALGESGRS